MLWSRKWQPTPVLLPGKVYGQRSVAGYSPWGRKEPDATEQMSTNKQGLTLIQVDLLSKPTITCTKIVFPNQVLFVGSGGYNLGIPLGLLLNLLQSGKKSSASECGCEFPTIPSPVSAGGLAHWVPRAFGRPAWPPLAL